MQKAMWKNYTKSIQFLATAIEKFPDNPLLYTLFGANLIYSSKTQWERAQEALNKAESLYQKNDIKNPPFHRFQVAHFDRLRSYQNENNFIEFIS